MGPELKWMNNCVFTHWVADPDSLLTNFLKKYFGHSFKEDFDSYKPKCFSLYLFPPVSREFGLHGMIITERNHKNIPFPKNRKSLKASSFYLHIPYLSEK